MTPRNPVVADPAESAPRRIQSGLKTLLTLTFRSVRLLALGAGLMVWLAGSPAQAGSWETCLGAEALTAEAACSEAILQADGTADRRALAYEARGRSRMLAGRLDAAIAQSEADQRLGGHYGVPLMVYGGEPFFGQDRYDQMVWRMEQQGMQRR